MSDFAVGSSASITKRLTDESVRAYAEITHDSNPVHLDDGFAAQTSFGKRIAHGMLTASLISAVLGTRLPGAGAIYLGQTLKFRRPVFIDDVVTATVEVIALRTDKPIMTLRTMCRNQAGEVVLEGEATMLLPASASE